MRQLGREVRRGSRDGTPHFGVQLEPSLLELSARRPAAWALRARGCVEHRRSAEAAVERHLGIRRNHAGTCPLAGTQPRTGCVEGLTMASQPRDVYRQITDAYLRYY